MVQNHLFQLLSLVAMEPPTGLSADAVRDEKVKVIRSLRRWRGPEEVAANIVRAQYTPGSVDGVERVGYRQEDRVNPKSMTECYVALRLFVDTWRWNGVPFYMRVGKQLLMQPVKMDFRYSTSFGKASPEAYERLLLDAMAGDATLFARRDEVEQAWAFVDTIEEAWAEKENAPKLCSYPAGSWGPEEADELLARDKRSWRRL